jgi:preprotein translocase subunit SecD
MEEARKIIESRVNALGVSEAEVVIEGNRNIVVSLAGEADDQLKNVGQAAQMRFRKVLKATGDVSATALNPPSAAPSAAPERRGPAGQRPGGHRQPGRVTGGQGGGAARAEPSAVRAARRPRRGPRRRCRRHRGAARRRREEGRRRGVGRRRQADRPAGRHTDPTAARSYAPFATLTGDEVNALTPQMQFNVPTISCDQLDKRPNGAIDAPTRR